MKDYIQLRKFPVKDVLKLLLKDKTTGKNITFATDSYADYGINFAQDSYITEREILGIAECEIQPRICKAVEQQAIRTKNKAEVFTPSWICNKMNNFCDEEWFGEKNKFNTENDTKWTANHDKIIFTDKKTWKKYVDLRFLEITCGECPYLVSRYDTATGDEIKGSQVKKIEKELTKNAEKTVNEIMGNFAIKEKQREEERKTALENPLSDKTAKEINKKYDEKRQQAVEEMTKKFGEEMQKFVQESEEKTVEHIEMAKAEIVKRLYNSDGMKEKYPDKEDRLKHIFEKQVYGLAPTEIIYRIAINFILGFTDETDTYKHNFRQADTLPVAKEGKLQALLDELYD